MFCHNCGTELEDDAVFCWNCGKAQTPVQPEQTAVSEEISLPEETAQPEQVVQSDETTVQFEQPAQFEEAPVQPEQTIKSEEIPVQPEQISEPEKEVKNEPKKEEKMVYCTRCGRTMPESSDECPNCQKSVSMNDDPSRRVVLGPWVVSKTAHKMIKERDKKIKRFAHGAMIFCIVLAVISLLIVPSVTVTPYVSVSFEGYNGFARPVVNYNYKYFNNVYSVRADIYDTDKEFPIITEPEDILELLLIYTEKYYYRGNNIDDILDDCGGKLLGKTKLVENGDRFTYVWKINDNYILDKYGFRVKREPVMFEAEGLEEAPELDLFEGFELICDGEDGKGKVLDVLYKNEDEDRAWLEGPKAKWENKPVEPPYGLFYRVDKYENLSNGDIITVTLVDSYDVNPSETLVWEYGFKPAILEKKFMVDGLTPVEEDETGNKE